MKNNDIHESAKIVNSQYTKLRAYKNVCIDGCTFECECSIGDDTIIERSKFENNVIINRRSYINDSFVGKYSYAGINTIINFSKIGRFCSIGRNVDIGGFDHDYHKFTTMPEFRFNQNMEGDGIIKEKPIHNSYCEIGNDVWIGAGAIILHKAKIGDGAVVGAGSVVTKDVPPYSIVTGVPAKVIGYRCSEKNIKDLLNIRWWEYSDEVLREIVPKLIHTDISDETIDWLKLFLNNK